MPENRKPFLILGIGLAGVAGWQLLQHPTPTPTPTPTSGPTPLNFPSWLTVCRSDVVAGLQQGRYRDVIGQYSREQQPGFWLRSDIAAGVTSGRWNDVVGQWLRENAPGFWARSDIALGIAQGRLGDVFGQFCREAGATRCVPNLPTPTQGNLARTSLPGQGPGGAPGTGYRPPVQTLPPAGKAAISDRRLITPGMLISTGCGWDQADYVVITDFVGPPGQLARLWIRDYKTWADLGAPRSALRIVTRSVLLSIRDGGTLYRQLPARHDWIWKVDTKPFVFSGGPAVPPAVLKSPAGWC